MNCKPGDLAIVINSDFDGDIGAIIEVLDRSLIDHDGDLQWMTKWSRPTKCNIGNVQICFIPDAWLRPVSGLPLTNDIPEEVVA